MENKPEFQNELFEEFVKTGKRGTAPKSHPIARQYRLFLNISYEQLILSIIALIVILTLTFTFGVERGKNLVVSSKSRSVQAEPKDIKKDVHLSTVSSPQTQTPIPAPTVEAPKPPQPAPTKAPSKPYTIQVATCGLKANAKKEMEKLQKRGFYTFIITGNGKYAVCVGEYANKDEADATMKKLRKDKDYDDCFLRRK